MQPGTSRDARLQAALEDYFGGRPAYEQFANMLLETSDQLMSRAHALRRLAERFNRGVESLLTAEERRLLDNLRRQHAEPLVSLAVSLEQSARPALKALGVEERLPAGDLEAEASWQAATETLLQAARRVEALLAALLTGAPSETQPQALPAQVLAALEGLRIRAQHYARAIPN